MFTVRAALLLAGLLPAGFFVSHEEKGETRSNTGENTVINTKLLPYRKNTAWKPGEVLTYRLHYGIIEAGVAVLEVKPQTQTIGGRKLYHMVGNAFTKGSFDWFYKVRDRYETYVDTSALVPWMFLRRVDEGGFKFTQDYFFNRHTNKVDVGNNEVFPIKDETQDMVSAFYSARNIDFSRAKEGDVFTIESFVDKENWPLKIKFVGRETIKSDIGKVRCLKFRPIVQQGRVFKKEEDLTVWVTDDANHIPVRGEAKVIVGSIKLDLVSVTNNLSPINLERSN